MASPTQRKTRGHSIVLLRCRRVLPDNALGREHRDAKNPGALFPKQLASLLRRDSTKNAVPLSGRSDLETALRKSARPELCCTYF